MESSAARGDPAKHPRVPLCDGCTPAKRVRLEDAHSSSAAPTFEKSSSSQHASLVVTPAMGRVPMKDASQIKSLLWKEAAYDSSDPSVVRKRSDYISWDDCFMAVACLSAHRSKDPIQPTGACIVDHNNRIIGIGYNGEKIPAPVTEEEPLSHFFLYCFLLFPL
jgi:hypothetical protein